MNAIRESKVIPRPRRRRPVWGIVAAVAAGMVVLFGLGFGLALLLKGGGSSTAEPAATASATEGAMPCATATIIPAQVLPDASSVVINVFNSTKRAGLAASTAKQLRSLGFTVKKVGNDPQNAQVQEVAELRYGPKGENGAKLLQAYLPGAKLVPIQRSIKRVDVVVGAQFTGLKDEAEVAAALAQPTESTYGPGCVTPSPTPSGLAPASVPAQPTPSAS